jgi:hypothetical protein
MYDLLYPTLLDPPHSTLYTYLYIIHSGLKMNVLFTTALRHSDNTN